jgi:hypothetical protein
MQQARGSARPRSRSFASPKHRLACCILEDFAVPETWPKRTFSVTGRISILLIASLAQRIPLRKTAKPVNVLFDGQNFNLRER